MQEPRGPEGRGAFTAGASAGLGLEKRREGKKCPQKRLEPWRERQQGVTQPPAPSPQGHGAVQLRWVCRGFYKDLPRELPRFLHAHTCSHTGLFFFLGGGVGHILLDKNACYRELFPDPAETSENKANMRIPTSTLYFFAHGRISHGTDSHGA